MNALTAFGQPLKPLGLRALGMAPAARPLVTAPRMHKGLTNEQRAHVTRLTAALLLVQESADALKHTPNFSSLLQADLNGIAKHGRAVNTRFLSEFTVEDAAAADSLNKCATLLSRLTLMVCSAPESIAEKAATAAYKVVSKWADTILTPSTPKP